MGDSHLLFVCRAVVSLSGEAQRPSHRPPSVGIQLILCALILQIPIAPGFSRVRARACRAAVSSSFMAQWPSHRAPSAGTQLSQLSLCALMFKISHRPHGKLTIACCLQGGGVYVNSGTVTISSSSIYGNTAGYVRAALMLKSSYRPLRFSRVSRSCLQGGGVIVEGGTVAISSCAISGNTASSVRAHVQNFPSPDGKMPDMLALTHACTTANHTSVSYSR